MNEIEIYDMFLRRVKKYDGSHLQAARTSCSGQGQGYWGAFLKVNEECVDTEKRAERLTYNLLRTLDLGTSGLYNFMSKRYRESRSAHQIELFDIYVYLAWKIYEYN